MQLEDIKVVLNSIPSQAAVLDAAGTIVQVNEAWSTFARENGGSDALARGVGISYLEICQSADGRWADEAPVAHDGIRAVLNETRATFELEYSCHSSTEKRWFLMTVLPFKGTLGWAVISHVDITQRKLAEIRRAGFARIVERSLNEIYIFDTDNFRFIEVNEGACRNLGYTLEELQSMTPVDIKPEHTEESFAALVSPLLNDRKDKIVFKTVHRRKDSSDYPVEVHLQLMMFDDRQMFAAIILDITERERQRLVAAVRSQTLEKMARGAPLDEILTTLVQTTEKLEPTVLASVLLVDSEARVLRCGAGPSLPDFYLSAIDGLEIADNVGACGTAAFRGERVISEDLRTDPRWENYRDLVETAGLRACWSEPILSSKQEVLGTFAFYYRKPGRPGSETLVFSQNSANVASIAIERARAEEALCQSEERFRDLIEGSVQGIVIERDGRALFANQSFADIFGYEDPAEIVTIESLSALYHPDELGRMAQHRKAQAQSGAFQAPAQYEFRGERKDGSAVWIETRERVVMWGDEPAMQSTVIDVTERHRAEEALFHEKERVQVTLESIGDAVITTDAQGRVNYCNAVAEALTGWRRDEAVGQPLTDVFNIINEETREPVANPVARCLTENTVV
ncbi:MAG: PAS domain S-box protein, partial [Pseudomonadales bacterium]